ncbi:MAG: diphthine synthase, partial [Candidatus Aenigmarchaeota archaeon]|nr:diphthine synthase [Candidatus Aenigmarchaeota archaeon]MDI6722968.1 diphthine synthase [Candidatus Aenigmarchaeota archaeon]
MLYIIGLGLNDEMDMSLKGIEAMKRCDEIYCELYTNKWNGSIKALEEITGKKITTIDREKAESDFLAEKAKECDVALLVPGDPFSATTHFEIFVECKKGNIGVEIIHSSSIFTAIAQAGLDLYKFGRTTTIVKPQNDF